MSKFAFDFKKEKLKAYREKPIAADNFASWSSTNFYRTSYISHYTNLPAEPKNVAYPGYAGFVPSLRSSNLYGSSYSPLTRQAFSNPHLGVDKFHLSTNGFNFNPRVHIDDSKAATSHRYGRQTIQNHHPCINTEKWETQSQGTFKPPKSFLNPTFRETERSLQTTKEFTRNSGFSQNHTQFDGKGWTPEEVLSGDMIRTEYRIQYNAAKPFQRNPVQFKLRKIKKPQQNYVHT